MARRVGQIKQRGDKTFLVRVFLGHSENGLRHYFNRTVRDTKKDADKVLTEILRRRDAGEPLEESKQTFKAYAEEWLLHRASSLRSNTIESYRLTLKNHAFPNLGSRNLAAIDATDLAGLYASLKSELSPGSLKLLHAILLSLFRQAFKANLIKRNPLLSVDAPKLQRREMQTMNADQAKAYLQLAQQTDYACLLTFMLVTGCRPSEAVGVKWSDIAFDQGTVTIQRQLKLKRKTEWSFEPVKSKSGNRTIALPAEFLRQLKDHRRQQNEQRLRFGQEWKNHNLVFCDPWGNALSMQPVRKQFKALLDKAKLQRFACAILGIPVRRC